jgi:hypothetical protein
MEMSDEDADAYVECMQRMVARRLRITALAFMVECNIWPRSEQETRLDHAQAILDELMHRRRAQRSVVYMADSTEPSALYYEPIPRRP